MINTPKLRGKMAEHGFTQETLATKLNMSRAGFSLCMHNKPKHYYKVNQVAQMRVLLKINDPAEADAIFFAQEVANPQQGAEA